METSDRYTLKSSASSSHSLLLGLFPAPGKGRRVLDAGCGNGYLAGLIAERGYDVTGIERPGYATDFPKTARLVEADLDQGLPELDGRFDYIVCADVLEHLRDPAGLLRQFRAVLAPGGKLIGSLPNSGNLYFRLVVLSGSFPQEDKGLFDRTHLRFYTWKGWADLLGSAGYSIDGVQPTSIPVGLKFPGKENSLPVRAAEELSYLLARLRKEMFAYQFVVTARANGGGTT